MSVGNASSSVGLSMLRDVGEVGSIKGKGYTHHLDEFLVVATKRKGRCRAKPSSNPHTLTLRAVDTGPWLSFQFARLRLKPDSHLGISQGFQRASWGCEFWRHRASSWPLGIWPRLGPANDFKISKFQLPSSTNTTLNSCCPKFLARRGSKG